MTVFYLIRHAEPDSGQEGRICLGRKLDVPLNEAGRKQAAMLGEKLRDVHLDAVYVSPLLRAIQTADALPHDCPRIVTPALTEVCSGEWDGMRFSDIYARYPSFFDLSGEDGGRTPPGGESDLEALARGMQLLDKLAEQKGKQFGLVTHSGIGRILICHLMGMPLYRKRCIPMRYASYTTVTCRENVWNVSLSEKLLTPTAAAGGKR